MENIKDYILKTEVEEINAAVPAPAPKAKPKVSYETVFASGPDFAVRRKTPKTSIPIVRLKPRGSIKRCPLLKDHKCSIHSAKPAVCALYPLGRAMSFEKGSYNHDGVSGGEIQYFISPFNCGDKTETHTVREWLTDFNLPVEDRYFLNWHAFISEVCLFIRKIEGKVSDKLLDTIWTTIYQLIYLCYDTGEDFMTQFERNKTTLLEIIQKSEQELGDVT